MSALFLDTNILLYAISTAPEEAAKQRKAAELLDRDDICLSVQVFQEFYVQATRPSRPDALPHDIAAGFIRTWTRFTIQDMTLTVMRHALDIKHQHRISYWDSAIVAAAIALGCETLMSEDMQHGRQIERVRIVDPFRLPG